MRVVDELLPGCLLLQGEVFSDERGAFRRLHSEDDALPCLGAPSQTAVSSNLRRGTLRGLHFQAAPHLECKLVQCLAGAVYDVMVDLRAGSPTFGRHAAAELSGDNGLAILAEPGFAHGFLTLSADALVFYMISPGFVAEAAGGLRWDDPDLAVPWPEAPSVMSVRDRALPRLRDHDVRLTTPAPAPARAAGRLH